MTTILAETLSGDWVITREHPEQPDVETELARFNASAVAPNTIAEEAMLQVITTTAARLDVLREGIRVQSHDDKSRRAMQARLIDQGAVVAA